jgi:DNA/RNA endonuclease YhcR with UshA esterase domain
MNRLWTVLILTSLISLSTMADETNAVAPKKIGAKEADKHFDETLTVTGKVAQVTIREKLVFLNLDQPHPNSPFTAVVFAANTNKFGDISKLKGKNVEVTGKIKNYNDAPEVVLDSTNQLKIVEPPAASDKPEQK